MSNIIQKICSEHNFKITYKPYRMWHSVPYINNTALAVDEYMEGGGHRIITNPKHFPEQLTEAMILGAIANGAYSLGRYTRKGLMDVKSVFTPWSDIVGDYPPGYHTHRLGSDVSCE